MQVFCLYSLRLTTNDHESNTITGHKKSIAHDVYLGHPADSRQYNPESRQPAGCPSYILYSILYCMYSTYESKSMRECSILYIYYNKVPEVENRERGILTNTGVRAPEYTFAIVEIFIGCDHRPCMTHDHGTSTMRESCKHNSLSPGI
jgi:hypothetical protein